MRIQILILGFKGLVSNAEELILGPSENKFSAPPDFPVQHANRAAKPSCLGATDFDLRCFIVFLSRVVWSDLAVTRLST